MRGMVFASVVVAALGTSGALAHGPDHAHGRNGHAVSSSSTEFAAGEPGDPRKLSRIVRISMTEKEDGRMLFGPDALTVRKGEQVRFVLSNAGKIEHEFVLDSPEGNAAHKAAMTADPAMEHHDPNARQVQPATTGEFVWRFTKAGTFEFACLIPGHFEAGMKGIVTVK